MTIYRYGKQKYIQLVILLFVFYCCYVNLSAADLSVGFNLTMAVITLWQFYRLGANIQLDAHQLQYRLFCMTYKTIDLEGLDFQAPELNKKVGANSLVFFSHHYEIGFYEGNQQVHQLNLNTGLKKAERVYKYLQESAS